MCKIPAAIDETKIKSYSIGVDWNQVGLEGNLELPLLPASPLDSFLFR
jgi:hypothetical protein